MGKIVEIKNLFNLNEKHIDTPSLLDKFNSDLEKYMSAQNTEFDRDLMYLDAANFIPSGKFVLFSCGEKLNKTEFPSIFEKSLGCNGLMSNPKSTFFRKTYSKRTFRPIFVGKTSNLNEN